MDQDCPECGKTMVWKYLNIPRCLECKQKEETKNKYTVVLQRPDYMSETTPYVAFVDAPTPTDAAVMARLEAFTADRKDRLHPKAAMDYYVSVVFNGQCKIELFGWQL